MELVQYDNNAESLITSFVERFPEGALETQLDTLWTNDAQYF